jgi:hypothetical protein
VELAGLLSNPDFIRKMERILKEIPPNDCG